MHLLPTTDNHGHNFVTTSIAVVIPGGTTRSIYFATVVMTVVIFVVVSAKMNNYLNSNPNPNPKPVWSSYWLVLVGGLGRSVC